MKAKRVQLPATINENLLKEVDQIRGDVPRTRYVERAIEAQVKKDKARKGGAQ